MAWEIEISLGLLPRYFIPAAYWSRFLFPFSFFADNYMRGFSQSYDNMYDSRIKTFNDTLTTLVHILLPRPPFPFCSFTSNTVKASELIHGLPLLVSQFVKEYLCRCSPIPLSRPCSLA